MIHSIIAILGGAIAASSLITSKSPSSEGFINSIAKYKGIIGVLLLIWGAIGIFRLLSHGIFSHGIIRICSYAAEFIVGFLLAYELIQTNVLNNNQRASEIGEDMKRGLSAYQVPAGVVLIILGVLNIIF